MTLCRFAVGLAVVTWVLQGCQSEPERPYYVLPGVAAEDNRVAENANVFVHISNQGMSDHLKFFFEIDEEPSRDHPKGRSFGSGWGIIGFGPHTYWTYGFALPPGPYILHFDDHIGEGWDYEFEVQEDGTHLDLTYWLRSDIDAFHERGERIYRADLKVMKSDKPPIVF